MIELKLDPKWKWAAMDECGVWCFYGTRPKIRRAAWFSDEQPGCGEEVLLLTLSSECDWRDSLHEIVHQDGKVYIKKHVDIPADGEPVIVWNNAPGEHRRYSAGKTDEDGWLECYCDGATRWSADRVSTVA